MAKKAAKMTTYQEREVYEAIGAFVFHFSELEFTIRPDQWSKALPEILRAEEKS
jgi:hypothetical protein